MNSRPDLRRRGFVIAALGGAPLIWLPRTASAGDIVEAHGNVRVNGRDADEKTPVVAGDTIETGANSKAVFRVNEDAYLMRANSMLRLEKKTQFDTLVSGLRMVTGALAVVFGRGEKRIYTRTLTAGIRGTGIYLEAKPEATYFCTCYGATDLETPGDLANRDREHVVSSRHVSRYIYASAQSKGGPLIVAAPTVNHTNEEMAMLENLVGRSCPLMEHG